MDVLLMHVLLPDIKLCGNGDCPASCYSQTQLAYLSHMMYQSSTEHKGFTTHTHTNRQHSELENDLLIRMMPIFLCSSPNSMKHNVFVCITNTVVNYNLYLYKILDVGFCNCLDVRVAALLYCSSYTGKTSAYCSRGWMQDYYNILLLY